MALLLCDLDDTLADRRALFGAWAASYLAEIGGPAADLAWIVGIDGDGTRDREEFFGLMIERYGRAETVASMTDRYHRDYLHSFRCEPDVVDALARARRAGFKVGIITNGDPSWQEAKIAAAGLADRVDAYCMSGAEGYWKPAPELFRIAADRCGEPLEGGWMVGDSPVADIGGATACGMRSVWMRMDRTWPADLDYPPTGEADTFAQAVDYLVAHG